MGERRTVVPDDDLIERAALPAPLARHVPRESAQSGDEQAGEPAPDFKVEDFTTDRPQPETKAPYLKPPFDPAESREWVRRWTAILLIGAVLLVIVGSFVILGIKATTNDGLPSEDLKDVISIIFTPLIGVVGTVLGFYFASKDRN